MIAPGSKSDYRFVGAKGYLSDDDTGLDMLGARYYSPRLGRFLTPDPIGQKGGPNVYAYCGDNPLTGTDPSGLTEITAYYTPVMAAGNHFFLAITDNVKSSRTYGQSWIAAGFPKNGIGMPWDNSPLFTTVGPAEQNGTYNAYDMREGRYRGKVTLLSDQSPAAGYVSKAEKIRNLINEAQYIYSPLCGNNSNSVFNTYITYLNLSHQWLRARDRYERSGNWLPWAPGIGQLTPLLQTRVPRTKNLIWGPDE